MPSPAELFLLIVTSVMGMVYVNRGRRDGEPLRMVSGIALMVYPYVVHGWLALSAVGLLIAALPRLSSR